MKTIILDKKYILEYIKDLLNDFKLSSHNINNAKYHHNSFYYEAPSICKYGILSMAEQQKQGIKNYSETVLESLKDTESHINGINGISLSIVGLKDIYAQEEEYDPFTPHQVDFLISSDIKAHRSSIHYGNEFISNQSIDINKIKAIDIRLFKHIENNSRNIEDIIEKYNYLREIALVLKETNIDIPIREMSLENNTNMDIDKIAKTPKLILKP